MILIEAALNTAEYKYFHLLSGADSLIKPISTIIDYFEKTDNIFLYYCSNYIDKCKYRFRCYHPFQEKVGHTKGIARVANELFIYLQRLFHVNRVKNSSLIFDVGANWFSIPHYFAKYVISQEDVIRSTFKNTLCCDEVFMQTIAKSNSDYFKHCYCEIINGKAEYKNMRYVDWTRGRPYCFTENDFQEVISQDCFFVRKTNLALSKMLYEYNCQPNNFR